MKKNIFIAALLIIIDQIIKLIVYNTLRIAGREIVLIPRLLSLNYLENTGASFGVFLTQFVLIGLGLVIIIFIIRLLFNKKYQLDRMMSFGLSLILAGGIGNLIDRIFRGYVIDYLDISNLFKFPIFNLADIYISIGVIIIFINIIITSVQAQEHAMEERK